MGGVEPVMGEEETLYRNRTWIKIAEAQFDFGGIEHSARSDVLQLVVKVLFLFIQLYGYRCNRSLSYENYIS